MLGNQTKQATLKASMETRDFRRLSKTCRMEKWHNCEGQVWRNLSWYGPMQALDNTRASISWVLKVFTFGIQNLKILVGGKNPENLGIRGWGMVEAHQRFFLSMCYPRRERLPFLVIGAKWHHLEGESSKPSNLSNSWRIQISKKCTLSSVCAGCEGDRWLKPIMEEFVHENWWRGSSRSWE